MGYSTILPCKRLISEDKAMRTPLVLTRRSDFRDFVSAEKKKGRTLGFVPTMGALHEGHASLLRKASAENATSVLSVFVNPKQFGPNEDFARYPRTFDADVAIAAEAGVTAVYAPTVEEMYPAGFKTGVKVSTITDVLCGAMRPGHFDGVCTVVTLLLNLARADKAYFGMKDYQQLAIIKQMCRDLAHPTEIVGVPTIREPDGLAMSSRNRYLVGDSRQVAKAVPTALATAAKSFLDGETSSENLLNKARAIFAAAALTPQYLDLRDAESLELIQGKVERPAVLAVAQIIPKVECRLIDNVVLGKEEFYKSLLSDLIRRTQSEG